MTSRHLRPGRIVVSGAHVWLVDRERPAAAVVAADGSVRLVHWQEVAHDFGQRRILVPDGVGIVRQVDSAVTWVRPDGSTITSECELTLVSADPQFAFFDDGSGRLLALAPDGSRQSVDDARPPTGPVGPPAGRPVPPEDADEHWNAWDESGDRRWIWLPTSPAKVLRAGERAGGLVWWAANDREGDKIDREVTVLGHDPDTGAAVVRVDAGAGMVVTATAVGDEFWVAIARRRFHRVSNARGVEVLAFSPAGHRTVLEPDAYDISFTNPPLIERPSEEEIRRSTEQARHGFDRLVELGRHPERRHESERSLSDFAVTTEGEWPFVRLVVTFRHTARPGLVLRRTFRLFDQRGRPLGEWISSTRPDDLEEDMYSGYISPADEAVDGVLET